MHPTRLMEDQKLPFDGQSQINQVQAGKLPVW